MRMICPHCGLGGTAAAQYYLKKVRCPNCRKVFRVTEKVVVDPVAQISEVSVQQTFEDNKTVVEEKDSEKEEASGLDSTLEDSGLRECAVCGFSFSSDFISIIDDKQICPVCAN